MSNSEFCLMEGKMQDIFIKRLEALMEEKDMSQTELANKIGTTNVTISRYLSGERIPRLEIVAKIAEVFHTSVDYLVGLTSHRNASWARSHAHTDNSDMIEIQKKLESIGSLNAKKRLSASQLALIKNLLDTNKDFINHLKEDNGKNVIA